MWDDRCKHPILLLVIKKLYALFSFSVLQYPDYLRLDSYTYKRLASSIISKHSILQLNRKSSSRESHPLNVLIVWYPVVLVIDLLCTHLYTSTTKVHLDLFRFRSQKRTRFSFIVFFFRVPQTNQRNGTKQKIWNAKPLNWSRKDPWYSLINHRHHYYSW